VVANATYRHDSKNLMRGTLRAHVASNQVPLAQFQQLVKDRPGLGGTVSLSGDVTATSQPSAAGTDFQLTSVAGSAAARSLQMEGRNLGDFTATANTSGATIRYDVTSNFAGSTIRVNGQSMLTGDHKTTADAQIANLPIDRVLALAGRRDLPVSGAFNATAQVSGTLQDPHATANLNITNGSVYQEPFNRLQAAFTYSSQSIDVSQLRLDGGGGNIELSGSFAHPLNSLQDGQVRFRVHSSQLQLAQLRTLRQYKAGLAGTVEVAADGAATLRPNAAPLFSTLNANLSAKGLSVDKKPVGDLTATAETRGKEVQFSLNSNFARSTIRGSGRMELSGDYPLSARLSFSSVTWSGLQSWIGGPPRPDFDASADGEVSVEGPATRTDALRGTLQLTRLEAHSVSPRSSAKPRIPFELHNDGAVAASLNGSTVTIRNAKIAGPYANLAITGTASMNDAINLRVDGKVKLEVLEAFDPDIFSSGSIALNATVTGAMAKPAINGRLQFQDASFNMIDVPNGLSNANGAVAFNGSDALIQNITGQSGGGKITLAGLVSYGGPETQFRVQATAEQVHVEYPQTITTEASARLTLAGTTQSSLLSGTVRILEVAMHSHSDMGSILTSAPPASSPANSAGLLAGMRFDVKIATSSNAQFRTSLAQNLQADANVTLRGSPDHPGMLGRIAVTQGDVLFFGAQYTINQGTVSFYNPQKIDPILDVTLETTVQGIQVSLGVSGSADKMKLSYSSDPPLQLTEIVSLLASGKAPSGDPVMAARQSPAPQQNISQQGASMLLGQAFASPVSGRLQRLFGVSKLKIDPQVTGGSNTPQATLTMQQQITRDVTFTYIQDVTQSNPTIIRMEWAINPRWSAIAARDVNGEFNVDLFYKRRFR
jgi:translocation and assembly module TamB